MNQALLACLLFVEVATESYLAGATLKRLPGLEAVAATYKPNNNLFC